MELLKRFKGLRAWWVIVFCFFCFILFEQGIWYQNQEFAKLSKRKEELENARAEALDLQNSLLLQINSESDPAWIELVLMHKLGLVPEGQIKVYFPDSS